MAIALATAITAQTVIASLVMGAIIGLVELFFVHADERGLGWLTHGLHALPVAMFLTFVAMHVQIVYQYIPGVGAHPGVWVDFGIRFLIGIIAVIKVKGAAAVIQGHNSIGEKLGHAVIIGALIAASPYIYIYIAPLLPAWLGGGTPKK